MREHLLDSKWRSICLSVFLAVVFWLYVRAEVDPTQPGVLRQVPVELTGEGILTSQGLTVANISTDTGIAYYFSSPQAFISASSFLGSKHSPGRHFPQYSRVGTTQSSPPLIRMISSTISVGAVSISMARKGIPFSFSHSIVR